MPLAHVNRTSPSTLPNHIDLLRHELKAQLDNLQREI
jgi:hypothetical protein